ncbi:hypothetical protein KGM_209465 [Danaus plexippus plexippus]|uniref:Uncharacterized protein n=1 Tax=Danaus plexippus plexippus TaxID=278856 RepID=A0A212F683_DANPL|nr:hypothetical protein KGM_209465 [Danaus plexippus plexippus]
MKGMQALVSETEEGVITNILQYYRASNNTDRKTNDDAAPVDLARAVEPKTRTTARDSGAELTWAALSRDAGGGVCRVVPGPVVSCASRAAALLVLLALRLPSQGHGRAHSEGRTHTA